jgi:hypothetical protein
MNFSDALERNMDEIERPANLPIGNYIWQISKLPEQSAFESSRTGKTFERVDFMVQCVSPSDDVDPDELEEYGNVAGTMNRKSFLFSTDEEDKAGFDRSMFQLKQFLEHCGIENMTLAEAFPASVGTQFMGEVKHRPDPNDAEVIYAEIGRTAVA